MYSEVFKLHSELLKALANPKRLEIIQLLRGQELTVTEIQNMLYLPQGNLSQHLMVLRDAKVVKTRRNGKQIYYRIAHKNFIKASDLMRGLLVKQHQNDPLASELTKKMTDLVPLTQDPVCGMRISPKTASFALKENGKSYYFCASGCYEEFKKKPEKFIKEVENG
ncbi:metalloregulator ArsR/SmtB family transcription factor [Candidatus Roizmanbacteria bacterium]|nr:metalloregulator ArsR/SmtB family transcription factor [Candidatus Roizmanbacteria bacterium]